jgi:hypothetical protein
MTCKIMATVAIVIMAAGANCGCSAVPSGTFGQVASGRAAPARVSYAATSPTVAVPGERVVGADPDANVRFDLLRNADFYLHGHGGANN